VHDDPSIFAPDRDHHEEASPMAADPIARSTAADASGLAIAACELVWCRRWLWK
jgi:hypothetical protein